MNAKQCRMARAGLNVSGRGLATLSGVGYATIARFESGSAVSVESVAKLTAALEGAGAAFTSSKGLVRVTVPE